MERPIVVMDDESTEGGWVVADGMQNPLAFEDTKNTAVGTAKKLAKRRGRPGVIVKKSSSSYNQYDYFWPNDNYWSSWPHGGGSRMRRGPGSRRYG
jgi:hypothetical protein